MVPPPKVKKPVNNSVNINNDNNYNGQESSSYNNDLNINQSNNNSNNSGPVFGNNKINNPFAAAQFKKQPKPPQLNQKKNMNNLHNRYAVGYNK